MLIDVNTGLTCIDTFIILHRKSCLVRLLYRMSSPESSTDHLLDFGVAKCFAPIYNLQMLLGSLRVHIKNKSISTPTTKQNIYSFTCMILVTFSFCYFQVYLYQEFHHRNSAVYMFFTICVILEYNAYVISMIYMKLWKRNLNITIYLLLQKIDRSLNFIQFQHLHDFQYRINILMMVFIFLSYGIGYLFYVYSWMEYPLLTIFLGLGMEVTYIEIVLTGSLVYYIALRLRSLNQIIRQKIAFSNYRSMRSVVHRVITRQRDPAPRISELEVDRLVHCLKDILKAHKLITQVFRFPVFILASTGFIWSFMGIETIVLDVQTNLMDTTSNVIIILWIIYYLILLTALATVNDYFIGETKKTKLLCIRALSYNVEDGPVRKAANDVLHTILYSKPEFSVYGVFVVKKTLPLQLIGVITTNTAVLIQFSV